MRKMGGVRYDLQGDEVCGARAKATFGPVCTRTSTRSSFLDHDYDRTNGIEGVARIASCRQAGDDGIDAVAEGGGAATRKLRK